MSNTKVSKYDISKTEEAKYDMLLHIIKQGRPISVYETKKALGMNQPTVRNIFLRLKEAGFITVYEEGSRNKLMYGPMWHGLLLLCGINPKMHNEMDTILDGWFTNSKFVEILKEQYGEVVTENPGYAKTLVKKMVKHIIGSMDEFEKMTEPEHLAIQLLMGEQLFVAKHPAEQKNCIEYMNNVKFYRDNVRRSIAGNKAAEKFIGENLDPNKKFPD